MDDELNFIYPVYVLKRMIERSITTEDIRNVHANGEVIEEYANDEPPRYLMLGWSGERPIHVVFEDDLISKETIIVTAYEPDEQRWKENYATRKK